jgi:hypothetical protein
MYLVFSAFTYSPISLAATTKGFVTLFMVCTLPPPNIPITIISINCNNLPNPYSVRVKYFFCIFSMSRHSRRLIIPKSLTKSAVIDLQEIFPFNIYELCSISSSDLELTSVEK